MATARVSSSSNPGVPEPTPAELQSGASLVQEPERLESRATEPPPPPATVQRLVAGPGIALGGDASVGIVVDFTEPKISIFTSGAWGTQSVGA